jgi:hypothetical protein
MQLRMAWEQHGVPQSKAAMLPKSFITTQKGKCNGIR